MGTNATHLLLAILAATLAAPAEAANLLPNATFDSDVAGWDGGFAQWSAEDAAGSPDSGSLELENPDVLGATVGYACVAVEEGASYRYGGKYLIDSGQAAAGQISVQLRWFHDPACAQFLFLVNPTLDASVVGAWTSVLADADAPAGAQGASIGFFDMKQSGPAEAALVVHFDDAFLPEPMTRGLEASALGALGLIASRRRAVAPT